MVRLLKVVERVLIIVGLGAFVWLCYLQLRYATVMPREPDSASGRVYSYNATRFHVYVTQEEADRGRLAEIVGPLGILAVMGGVPLLRWFAGRRPQR